MLLLAALGAAALAQKPAPQEPPEEDESLQEREYAFNPLQAEKELKVGNFYFKKGSYRAAASRFEEATKWNPGYAEAYLRLGQAQEKLAEAEIQPEEKQKAVEAARRAYEKYLELAPRGKEAESVRKKLASRT